MSQYSPELILRSTIKSLLHHKDLSPYQVSQLIKAPNVSISRREERDQQEEAEEQPQRKSKNKFSVFVEWSCNVSVSVSPEAIEEHFTKKNVARPPSIPFQNFGVQVTFSDQDQKQPAKIGMKSWQGGLFDSESLSLFGKKNEATSSYSWERYNAFAIPIIDEVCKRMPSSEYLGYNPESDEQLSIEVGAKGRLADEEFAEVGGAEHLMSIFCVCISGSSTNGYGTFSAKTNKWYGLWHRHKRSVESPTNEIIYKGKNTFVYDEK
jgi:hypothetical protein